MIGVHDRRRKGGFEPFGTDYQAGTGNGALDNGLYLRLPGQWDDGTWADATSGAGIYYNVHRWYAPGSGRFTRPYPGTDRPLFHSYGYADNRPLFWIDPDGRKPTLPRLPPTPLFIPREIPCIGAYVSEAFLLGVCAAETGGAAGVGRMGHADELQAVRTGAELPAAAVASGLAC
jgi:RHS repeat-associated protein